MREFFNFITRGNIIRRMSRTPDLLHGSIWKNLVLLSTPIVISRIFQTLYNVTDAFWLGKLGKEALAAPTITHNIVWLTVAVASGLGVGGSTLVAQYKGADNEENMRKSAGSTLLIVIILGIAIGIIGFITTPLILRLLQTPGPAFAFTENYMRIMFTGLPFVFVYFLYQGLLRGYGNTISPMKLIFFTVGLNIILDPFLIFGLWIFPKLGVTGAAIATVFSQGLSSIVAIFILFAGTQGIKIDMRSIKPDIDIWAKIMKIGLPMSFGQMGTSLGFTLMMGLVNTFGTAVVGAFGVAHRIISMLVMPAIGLSQGSATFVAQNMGARQVKRAEKSVWTAAGINASVVFIFTTLLFFFGEYVVQFFINDPEVIAIGGDMFRITSYSVLFFSVMMVFTGAFKGSGHTLPVLIMQIFRLWGVRIPFAYLFAKHWQWGPNGIFWAMFLSNIVITIIAFIWFRRGSWKKGII